jgi:hypothetical protein
MGACLIHLLSGSINVRGICGQSRRLLTSQEGLCIMEKLQFLIDMAWVW